MQHDLQLRAAVREIYDACYPGEESLFAFPEAEQRRTFQYLRAVDAAKAARSAFAFTAEQPALI